MYRYSYFWRQYMYIRTSKLPLHSIHYKDSTFTTSYSTLYVENHTIVFTHFPYVSPSISNCTLQTLAHSYFMSKYTTIAASSFNYFYTINKMHLTLTLLIQILWWILQNALVQAHTARLRHTICKRTYLYIYSFVYWNTNKAA